MAHGAIQSGGGYGVYGGYGVGGGYGGYGGDQSGGGWHPDYSKNMGPRKIFYDSKIFETKVALEKVNQYDGGKTGHSWKSLIKGYLVGKLPVMGKLLTWAEEFKKVPITGDHVMNLRMTMEDDPIVVAHLLWAFFNLNLVGEAREIFSNIEASHGFEVWRRICNKINVRARIARMSFTKPSVTRRWRPSARTWPRPWRIGPPSRGSTRRLAAKT